MTWPFFRCLTDTETYKKFDSRCAGVRVVRVFDGELLKFAVPETDVSPVSVQAPYFDHEACSLVVVVLACHYDNET